MAPGRKPRQDPIETADHSHVAAHEPLMPITHPTLTSSDPAALRECLAGRVADLRAENPLTPVHVLVGASLQRPFLDRFLADRLGAHANVRIHMPGDLALVLGAPSLVAAGRRALPPLADRVLLAQVASSLDGYFAPVAETAGFAEALYRLVRDLKGAGFDLGDLDGALAGTTDAAEKAPSLAELLNAFEARRTAFYGPDDALQQADPDLLDGSGLLVYGVLDPSPLLEQLIVAVAQRMPVDVYLPNTPGVDDAPAAAWRRRLEDTGAVVVPAPAVGRTRAGNASALSQIVGCLFEAPDSHDPIAPDRTVRLVSGPDPAREVKAAARACLGWAAEGIPFWQMAIAYRQADEYRPVVEAVFAEAQIPVYLHEGSPLAERPLGRRTLALLALFDSELSRQSVMDFLSDARLPKARHDEYDGGVPASRWDSVSREAGIVAGAEQWRTRLSAVASDVDEEDAAWLRERAQDAENLAAFVADLDKRLHAHGVRATWAEHLDYLRDLLTHYVDGAEQIVDALRGLERFTALESEVAFEIFLDVVRRAIATLRSEEVLQGQAGAFMRRGVNAIAVDSLPGLEFACVWILGASERSFPPPARQDPILLDAERKLISERTGKRLPLRGERGSEEEFRFALACEAAHERLAVSYARRASGEKHPRLPSVFFREVASQLEGVRVSADDAPLLGRPDVERIPGDAIGAPTPGGRNAKDRETVSASALTAISTSERDRTYLQADVTRPASTATFAEATPSFARAIQARRARRSDRYSEWDGALGPAGTEAAARLLEGRLLSPTAVQSYASCPHSFLMTALLRIRTREEPERTVRIDAMRRGNLFHRIFERFHSEWNGKGPAALSSDAITRMNAIAGEECAAAAARGETGYAAMWSADQEEIIEDCLQWLAAEREQEETSRFPLSACEARFGPPRAGEPTPSLHRDEPVRIELGAHTLNFAGRIDRVSWDTTPPKRFRVIDYKTGKVRDERPGQLQGGRMLQLPLYVLAAAELLGLDPKAGEAAYVYPTRRGRFKTVTWSADSMAERDADVLQVLGGIAEGIARGDFMIAPHDASKACTYCPMNDICPTPRADYVDRRENDPRVAPLLQNVRSVE
jgi:ATP-dependent helicase/nuclease subunit B